MRVLQNAKVSVLMASLFLVSCGCQESDQTTENSDSQKPVSEPAEQNESTNVIVDVDEDVERGMQADHFERQTETGVVQPIEKATDIPTGPVTDGNAPIEP